MKSNYQTMIAAIFVVAAIGCSAKPTAPPTSATVEGEVLFNGARVTGGMISVVSDEDPGKRQTGMIRQDGTFRLAGAPIGKSWVAIDTSLIRAKDPGAYVAIPDKYLDIATTDASIELEGGLNEGVSITLTQ